MSKIPILALAGAATYVANQFSTTPFSVTVIAVLFLCVYLPLSCLWSMFLRPLYFSELLDLPQPPVSYLQPSYNSHILTSTTEKGFEAVSEDIQFK
jgi:hypothetical protein